MSQIEKPLVINADDPGLTAYALGELDAADAARYAEAVAASPELQAIVASIQAEARILSNELRQEPTVTVTAERRAEIIAQATGSQTVAAPLPKRFLGVSQRTAAVAAASVLLVPGAWYVFQTAFPRVQRASPVVLSAPPAARSSRDDLRYPTGNSTVPANETQSVRLTRGVDDYADVTSGASAGHPAISNGSSPSEIGLGELSQIKDGNKTVEELRGRVPGIQKEMPADPNFHLSTRLKGEGKEVAEGLRYDADSVQDFSPRSAQPQPVDESKPRPAPAAKPQSAKPQSADDYNKLLSARTKFSTTMQSGLGSSAGDRLSTAASAAPLARNPVPSATTSPARNGKAIEQLEKTRESAPQGRPASLVGGPSVEAETGPARKSGDDPAGDVLALAEIQRIKQLPMKDLDTREIERLRWAQRQVGWAADPTSNEAYNPIFENGFVTPAQEPLSTFSIDVDTASYANLRRFLMSGQLPPPDAVRIEELVNYFAYQYPQPEDGRPFSVQTDIAACPWQPGHQLVRIGLKGKEIPKEQRAPTNLVFLVDVSGSMAPENKLPLVRESLKTLVGQLDERDKIAIVTYAGQAGIALPSTSVAQRETIIAAINSLGAGGSTNGAAGINTAYDIAAQEFLEKGTNRVILCTDGDFNVGVTSDDALVQMIQTRAKGGVFLSIFGFGMGNLKDAKLEQLADKGNGQYGYIDDRQEADKVFIQEMMGTLVTIAKDVKIQIDFNKEAVASYRLVGYENRVMAAEDFHNDKKDAGEIGSGHTVTALYEIVPTKELKVDDKTRWLTVKLRYKQPEASESVLFEDPLTGPAGQLKLASSDFQFASSVAACGMLLRHSQHAGQANWALVKELAQAGLSHDPHGHRRGFLSLVSQAESLMGQLRPASPPAPDSTVRGKYKSLLRRLNVPEDSERYGQFNDYGFAETKSYGGSDNLPAGYWVYIAPHWYIWAETTQPDVTKRQ